MLSRELLYEFEKGLNPQKPAESKIPARIVGYGEISAIFEIEADNIHVYKRLPLFDSLVAARHYQQMYLDYCSLLEKAGLSLPDHDTQIVVVPGRPTALYIAQKKLPDANFGHKLIHHLDDGASLEFIKHAIREIVKIWNFNSAHKPDIELAIDGQISNWVRDSENNQRLYYIDTSTPLFCKQGVEQQNPELLLKSAPGILRWIIRIFFLQDVMTRYYIPRLVFMDLIANLHKEQKPELIEPVVECVNEHLPHDQAPLTKTEVDKYYREDKLIWIVFLGLRRLDRFFSTRLLWKRYEFILPGKIKR
ncbi:MAG: hypothetical protein HKO68_16665 [Desulfobacterales bacterium]|nr:hypothetical protein [Desulfobacterales bacterium]